MKVTLTLFKGTTNQPAILDLDQPAKCWLGAMICALGDQIAAGYDGVIGIEIEGAVFALRVIECPGALKTYRTLIALKEVDA